MPKDAEGCSVSSRCRLAHAPLQPFNPKADPEALSGFARPFRNRVPDVSSGPSRRVPHGATHAATHKQHTLPLPMTWPADPNELDHHAQRRQRV